MTTRKKREEEEQIKQEELFRLRLQEAEEELRSARRVDALAQQTLSATAATVSTKKATHAKLGNIDRFGTLLSTLSASSAIHAAMSVPEDKSQRQSEFFRNAPVGDVFLKAYKKSIQEKFKSGITGRDHQSGQSAKAGDDLLKDFAGWEAGWKRTIAGIGIDIAADPSIVGTGPVKATAQALRLVGKGVTSVLGKTAAGAKAIDKVAAANSLFYKVNKTVSAEDAKEFQRAYAEFVGSGNPARLEAFGIDMRAFTKPKAGANITDPATRANFKPRTPSQIVASTPELEAARAAAQSSEQALMAARQTLTKVKHPNYVPTDTRTLNDLWKEWATSSGHKVAKDIPDIADGLKGTTDSFARIKDLPAHALGTKDLEKIQQLLYRWDMNIVKTPGQHAYQKFAKDTLAKMQSGKALAGKADEIKAAEDAVKKLEAATKAHQANVAKITKANTQMSTDYSVYYKTLEEGLAPAIKSSKMGNVLQTTNDAYKRLMSWSPIFQSRNVMGATLQGLTEGAKPLDFIQSFRMVQSKGATNPDTWTAMQKAGQLTQPGMAEQGLARFPGRVAAYFESINRGALVIAKQKAGKSMDESIDMARHVFYDYGTEFMTSFQKNFLGRILPFLSFNKGQLAYGSEALSATGRSGMNRTELWRKLYQIKNGTMPEDTKDSGVPSYFGDLVTVGNVGGFGSQVEDMMAWAFGDPGRISGQTAPLLRGSGELLTGWNSFNNRPLGDPSIAKKYEHAPDLLQRAVGYNADTKSVNPYIEHIVQTAVGPILRPIMNRYNPKAPAQSPVTSVRAYDLTPAAMDRMAAMAAKDEDRPGFLDHLMKRLNLTSGPTTLTAGAIAPKTPAITSSRQPDAMDIRFASHLKSWPSASSPAPELFGIRRAHGAPGDQDHYALAAQRMGKDIAFAMMKASPDIGMNMAMSHAKTLETEAAAMFYRHGEGYKDRADWKQYAAVKEGEYQTMRPRQFDEKTMFSPGDFKYRQMVGDNSLQQYYNRGLTELVQFASKTADMWKTIGTGSFEGAARTKDAEIAAVNMQLRAQIGGIDEKSAASRIAAIEAQFRKSMEDLEGKGNMAASNLLKTWAEGEADALQKIEYDRAAAQHEFLGGKAYEFYRDNKFYESITEHKEAIDRKYDAKRSIQLADEAKKFMEMIELQAKGSTERALAAMADVYKRGGAGIDEYFAARLDKLSGQQATIASHAINQGLTTVGTGMSDAKTSGDLGKMADVFDRGSTLEDDLNNTAATAQERLDMIKKAIELFSERIAGINAKGMAAVVESLVKAANALQADIEAEARELEVQKENYRAALAETQQSVARLRLQNVEAFGGPNRLLTAFSVKSSSMFGQDTTPGMPKGYDINAERLKQSLLVHDQGAASAFQAKDAELKAQGIGFSQQGVGEDPRAYMERIEEEMGVHEENKFRIEEEGLLKVDTLKGLAAEKEKERNNIILNHERAVMQQKLSLAGETASGIMAIGQMLYEASGKQSKEAFYLMKAGALAEAIIKGALAVSQAYSAATGNPYLGTAYAAIIAAQVGAQVGIIAATTIAGPGKAEGGPIEGGSGMRDDVPIMAMGGEYVIKKSSVQKYGASFLDALNRGMIPSSDLNFAIPMMAYPDANRRTFEDGGMVTASNTEMPSHDAFNAQDLQIVNVIDPKLLDKYVAGADGQKTILNVMAANSYEIKRMLR